MKLRFSFTLKIMMPYLVLAGLFMIIFLSEFDQGHGWVIGLSAAGVIISLIMGIVHNVWLKKPLKRIRELVAMLTRGKHSLVQCIQGSRWDWGPGERPGETCIQS